MATSSKPMARMNDGRRDSYTALSPTQSRAAIRDYHRTLYRTQSDQVTARLEESRACRRKSSAASRSTSNEEDAAGGRRKSSAASTTSTRASGEQPTSRRKSVIDRLKDIFRLRPYAEETGEVDDELDQLDRQRANDQENASLWFMLAAEYSDVIGDYGGRYVGMPALL